MPCSASVDPVMTLTDPVHGGPIRAVHEQDWERLVSNVHKIRADARKLRACACGLLTFPLDDKKRKTSLAEYLIQVAERIEALDSQNINSARKTE